MHVSTYVYEYIHTYMYSLTWILAEISIKYVVAIN